MRKIQAGSVWTGWRILTLLVIAPAMFCLMAGVSKHPYQTYEPGSRIPIVTVVSR